MQKLHGKDEMIQRVALAIAEAEGRGMIFNPEDDWYETDGHRHERNDCYAAARAAGGAMREPTEAMYFAAMGNLGVAGSKLMAEAIWKAMIDEALRVD